MSLNAACSNTKMILSENAGEAKLIAAEKKESYSNAAINTKNQVGKIQPMLNIVFYNTPEYAFNTSQENTDMSVVSEEETSLHYLPVLIILHLMFYPSLNEVPLAECLLS